MFIPDTSPEGPAATLQYCYATYFQTLRPLFDLPPGIELPIRVQNEALASLTAISSMAVLLLDDLLDHEELTAQLSGAAVRLKEIFSQVAEVVDFHQFWECSPLGDEEMCQMGAIIEEAALLEEGVA